jgi:hypothetical protein
MGYYERSFFFDTFIAPFGVEKLVSISDSKQELSEQVGVVFYQRTENAYEAQPKLLSKSNLGFDCRNSVKILRFLWVLWL